MNKIVFATYIDNQKEIEYPIRFLLSENPMLIVFSSDEENMKCLAEQEVMSTVIGKKIQSPSDIALAQNACIDYVFEKMNADFVIWQQADTYITEEGYEIIKKFCVQGNEHKSIALNNKHIRLFHLCHTDYFGVTVFGKEHKHRFINDGACTEHTGGNQYYRMGSDNASIDIGYLSIEQCRKHLSQHKKTWGGGNDFSELSDKKFCEQFLRRNDVFGIIKKGTLNYELLRKLKLLTEYEQVKEFVSDVTLSEYGRMTNP